MPQRNMKVVAADLQKQIASLDQASPKARASAAKAISREAYKQASTFTAVLLRDEKLIARLSKLCDDSDRHRRARVTA